MIPNIGIGIFVLVILLWKFAFGGVFSASLIWAIVVLTIALEGVDYLPESDAELVHPQQEKLDKIMAQIAENHSMFMGHIAQLQANVKKADDKASSAMTASALKPRPLGMQGGER